MFLTIYNHAERNLTDTFISEVESNIQTFKQY